MSADAGATLAVQIRWMIRRDMPEVLRIEQDSFAIAWAEEDFLECLRQRNCIGMVAESGDHVVGFMVYVLHRDKLQLLNFAVAPSHRHRGIGRLLTAKVAAKLSQQRRATAFIVVRETNLAAQLFFSNCGFRAIGVHREHYEDTGEDGFVLEYATKTAVVPRK